MIKYKTRYKDMSDFIPDNVRLESVLEFLEKGIDLMKYALANEDVFMTEFYEHACFSFYYSCLEHTKAINNKIMANIDVKVKVNRELVDLRHRVIHYIKSPFPIAYFSYDPKRICPAHLPERLSDETRKWFEKEIEQFGKELSELKGLRNELMVIAHDKLVQKSKDWGQA